MIKTIPNFRLFLSLLLLSLSIFALDSLNFLNGLKGVAYYLTNPVSFGIYRTYQISLRQFNFIFLARSAFLENKALKEQLGQLLSENANLRKQLAQTKALVLQQQALDPRTYNLIPARPIGLARYLKIDKGVDSEIRVGQAAVFKDNLLGKVIQVSPNSANIQLLQDPDSKVAAFSQGLEGRAKGILVGQFGTELILDKILHEEQIRVGDLVYTEGTESFLPRGLILGKVTEVLEHPNEVFKQAKVKSIFDIRDLELVFVILE